MRVPKQVNSPIALPRCYSVSIEKKVRINIEIVRIKTFDNKENVLRSDELFEKNEPELEKCLKFENDPEVEYSAKSKEENSNHIDPVWEVDSNIRSVSASTKYPEKKIPEIEENLKSNSEVFSKSSEILLKPESGVKSSKIIKVSSILKKTVSEIQKSSKPNLNKTQNLLTPYFNSKESSGLGTDLNIVEVLSEDEIENSNNKPGPSIVENKSAELYSFGSSSQSSDHLQNSYFLC